MTVLRRLIPALLLAAGLAAGPAFAAGKTTEKLSGSSTFLATPQITTTLVDQMRAAGVFQLDAGLEIPDAALRSRAEQMMPRLRDAYRTAVVQWVNSQHRRGTVPDADSLQRRMQATTDQVLGRPGAQFVMVALIVREGR
jgi:hypothetical protein